MMREFTVGEYYDLVTYLEGEPEQGTVTPLRAVDDFPEIPAGLRSLSKGG